MIQGLLMETVSLHVRLAPIQIYGAPVISAFIELCKAEKLAL